jgi:hypothetical protein
MTMHTVLLVQLNPGLSFTGAVREARISLTPEPTDVLPGEGRAFSERFGSAQTSLTQRVYSSNQSQFSLCK